VVNPPAAACQTTNGTSVLSLYPAMISGMAVTINGVVIAPRGTKLTGIHWNWGDGTAQSGCAYFPETHDYASDGQYTVLVTTTFSNGSKKQAAEAVSISSRSSGPGTASSAPPPSTASAPVATCSTTNGTPSLSLFGATISGLSVTINGVVIAPDGTQLTGIDWNWGDGTSQTGCDYFPETHDYASAGQYTVVVTTTFTDGSQLQATETVSVS
jgi:PKD repeat protein